MPPPIPNEQNVNNLIPSLTDLTLHQRDSLPAAPWESADMDAKVRFQFGDESRVDALFPRGLNGPSLGVGGLCTALAALLRRAPNIDGINPGLTERLSRSVTASEGTKMSRLPSR